MAALIDTPKVTPELPAPFARRLTRYLVCANRSNALGHGRPGVWTMTTRWPHRFLLLLVVVGSAGSVLSSLGCSSDTTKSTTITGARAYYAMQLNQHAVNLALTPPYDTVQLIAVPVNAAGTPLVGLGQVKYNSSDTSVTVDSITGLVHANFVTSQTTVVAHLQAQGVTLTDTVFIQVTQTPAVIQLSTLSMQPSPGDSTNWAVDGGIGNPPGFAWLVTPVGQVRDVECGAFQDCPSFPILIRYQSSNPGVASIDPVMGLVSPQDTGRVVFTASTYAYGQSWRDSVQFVIGYAIQPTINVKQTTLNGRAVLSFQPQTQFVAVGATVTWNNQQQQFLVQNGNNNTIYFIPPGLDSIDIVFDDSTAVQPGQVCVVPSYSPYCLPPAEGGNIPAFGFDSSTVHNGTGTGSFPADSMFLNSVNRARSFPTAGTYTYHSRLFGTKGTIIVK